MIIEQHPEWLALQEHRRLIDLAEQAYRDDPELAYDLETVGWDDDRTAAAWEGRAVKGNPRKVRGPVLDLPGVPKLNPWQAFFGMRSQVRDQEERLRATLYPQVEAEVRRRERELAALVGALVEAVAAQLPDALVEELRGCALAAGRPTDHIPGMVDPEGLVAAVLERRSLFDPIPPSESGRDLFPPRPPGGVPALQVPTRQTPVPSRDRPPMRREPVVGQQPPVRQGEPRVPPPPIEVA